MRNLSIGFRSTVMYQDPKDDHFSGVMTPAFIKKVGFNNKQAFIDFEKTAKANKADTGSVNLSAYGNNFCTMRYRNGKTDVSDTIAISKSTNADKKLSRWLNDTYNKFAVVKPKQK